MTGLGDFQIKSIPEAAWDNLSREIKRIQGALPADKEIGIVANGADRPIHVDSVRLAGQMVVFSGTDRDGREATLIQHYTQINVQIIAVDKLEAKARRIGF